MSLIQSLPVEVLRIMGTYAGDGALVALARTSITHAVTVAPVVIAFRSPWRVQYSVYLRARYGFGAHVYRTVRRFSFVGMISRCCRCCGQNTQRRVNGTLLCCKCTRDYHKRCWMFSFRDAKKLGVNAEHIFQHSGARGGLVFGEHVQQVLGCTRRQLLMHLGLPCVRKA